MAAVVKANFWGIDPACSLCRESVKGEREEKLGGNVQIECRVARQNRRVGERKLAGLSDRGIWLRWGGMSPAMSPHSGQWLQMAR
jgi:hypothetical protein